MSSTPRRRPLLEEFLIRLELLLGAIGDEPISDVISSRDPRLGAHAADLTRLADDVRRWSPPFGGTADLLTSATIAGPGADLGPTLHRDGDAIRFILSGSVWFGGNELRAGEWLFIPAGTAYRLRVGYRGVISLLAIFRPGEAPPIEPVAVETLATWAD